mmetsp:Transcript_17219/g.19195  ORF Transcript_17219/g.19195 Transcript_17219/m.19195 type:complete len:389 (-) Transcript_17219:7-1173(-)
MRGGFSKWFVIGAWAEKQITAKFISKLDEEDIPGSVDRFASSLMIFISRVSVGDIVVTREPCTQRARGAFLVGQVTSKPYIMPMGGKSGGHFLVRNVEWVYQGNVGNISLLNGHKRGGLFKIGGGYLIGELGKRITKSIIYDNSHSIDMGHGTDDDVSTSESAEDSAFSRSESEPNGDSNQFSLIADWLTEEQEEQVVDNESSNEEGFLSPVSQDWSDIDGMYEDDDAVLSDSLKAIEENSKESVHTSTEDIPEFQKSRKQDSCSESISPSQFPLKKRKLQVDQEGMDSSLSDQEPSPKKQKVGHEPVKAIESKQDKIFQNTPEQNTIAPSEDPLSSQDVIATIGNPEKNHDDDSSSNVHVYFIPFQCLPIKKRRLSYFENNNKSTYT